MKFLSLSISKGEENRKKKRKSRKELNDIKRKCNLLQNTNISVFNGDNVIPDDLNSNDSEEISNNCEDKTCQQQVLKFNPGRKEYQKQFKVYSTEIKQLDKLFTNHGGIANGDVIEICGQAHVGKSLLIFTILINILVKNKDEEVVYFDTNNDFQASRMSSMMKARGMMSEDINHVLDRIKVVKIIEISDFLKYLDQLNYPENEVPYGEIGLKMKNLRFVVIDSITILFSHVSTNHLLLNKSLILKIQSNIHQLKMSRSLIFLITNLGLHKHKYRKSESDEDIIRGCNSSPLHSDHDNNEKNNEDNLLRLYSYHDINEFNAYDLSPPDSDHDSNEKNSMTDDSYPLAFDHDISDNLSEDSSSTLNSDSDINEKKRVENSSPPHSDNISNEMDTNDIEDDSPPLDSDHDASNREVKDDSSPLQSDYENIKDDLLRLESDHDVNDKDFKDDSPPLQSDNVIENIGKDDLLTLESDHDVNDKDFKDDSPPLNSDASDRDFKNDSSPLQSDNVIENIGKDDLLTQESDHDVNDKDFKDDSPPLDSDASDRDFKDDSSPLQSENVIENIGKDDLLTLESDHDVNDKDFKDDSPPLDSDASDRDFKDDSSPLQSENVIENISKDRLLLDSDTNEIDSENDSSPLHSDHDFSDNFSEHSSSTLHSYVNVKDNHDSSSTLHSDHVSNDNVPLDEITPALNIILWTNVLSYRLIITAPSNPEIDLYGFISIPRDVTRIEYHHMKTINLKITDVGFTE